MKTLKLIFLFILTSATLFAEQNLLYQNLIAHGSSVKNGLYDFNKAKLLFAEAIKYSQTPKELAQAKLLYNFTGQINLSDIFDFKADGAFFSKDENKILAWGGSKIKFIDIKSGKIIFKGIHNFVKNVILSKDETILFSWGGGNDIKMWDIKSGKKLASFNHKIDEIYGVKLNKNETKLLSFGKDNRVALWDLKTKKLILKYRHKKLKGAVFSQDNRYIYSFGKKKVKKYNIEEKKNDLVFNLRFWARGMKLDDVQNQLLVWNLRYISIFDINNGKLLIKIRNDDDSFLKEVVIDKEFNQLLYWDVKSGRVRFRDISSNNFFVINHNDKITGGLIGKEKIFTWSGSNLFITRIKDGKLLSHIDYKNKIIGAKFIHNQDKLALWGFGKKINFYKINTSHKKKIDEDKITRNVMIANKKTDLKEEKQIFSKNKKEKLTAFYGGNIFGVRFNKDETKFLSWGNRELKLWSISKENKIEFQSMTNRYYIQNIKFSDDMKKTIFITYDNIYFYNNQKKKLIFTLKPNKNNIFKETSLSYDKKELLVIEKDWITTIDIAKQKKILEINHKNIIKAQYIKDKIVSWSSKNIKIWNKKDGKLVKEINFENRIFGVTPNQKADKILFIQNRLVKLFDVSQNREILTIFDKNIVRALFSNDDKKIITWSFAKRGAKMKVWDKNDGKLLEIKNIEEFKNLNFDKYYLNSFFSRGLIYNTTNKNQNSMIFVRHYDKTIYYQRFDIVINNSRIEIRDKKSSSILFELKYPKIGGIYYDKKNDILVILSDNNLIFKKLSKDITLSKENYPIHTKLVTGAKLTEYSKIEAIDFKEWQNEKIKIHDDISLFKTL